MPRQWGKDCSSSKFEGCCAFQYIDTSRLLTFHRFQFRFLQERPDAISFFDFEFEFALNDASDHDENDHHDDDDENDENDKKYNNPLYKSQHFIEAGKNFITFVDQAIDMLGPADLESLTDSFVELGNKNHLNQYNLPSKLYPVLGSALLGQLDEMLGPEVFTIKTRGAWLQLFRAISLDMTPEPPIPEPEQDEDPELEHEKKQKKKSPLFFGRKRLSFERRKSNERRNSNGSRNIERRHSNERRYSNERRRLSNDSGHSISRRRFSNDSGHSVTRRRFSNDS